MQPLTVGSAAHHRSHCLHGNVTVQRRTLLVYIIALAVAAFYLVSSTFHRPPIQRIITAPPICPRPPEIVAPRLVPPAAEVNVLITGGAGYIGSHMSLLLLLHTEILYNILVVDDLSRGDMRHIRTLQGIAKEKSKKFTFVKEDIGHTPRMTALMQEHSIDLVIHFAGYAYASESVQFPLRYFDNIVTRLQTLLESMGAAGVKRLVFSSSSATYGNLQDKCSPSFSEWTPQKPESPYGTAKLMAEQVATAFAKSQHLKGEDFSVVMLRYFNVIGADPKLRVGPMPKPELAQFSRIVDACFDAALHSTPMKLYGSDYPTLDGTTVRDYIHVMDLVDAHMALTHVAHHKQMESYNIGIGKGFSSKELIESCQKATGYPVTVEYHPRRIGDPAVVLGNTEKLTAQLDWKPQYTDLTESIKTAWQWRVQVEYERREREREAAKNPNRGDGAALETR